MTMDTCISQKVQGREEQGLNDVDSWPALQRWQTRLGQYMPALIQYCEGLRAPANPTLLTTGCGIKVLCQIFVGPLWIKPGDQLPPFASSTRMSAWREGRPRSPTATRPVPQLQFLRALRKPVRWLTCGQPGTAVLMGLRFCSPSWSPGAGPALPSFTGMGGRTAA